MFSFTPNFGPKVTICIALLATGFTVCNATADVAMMNNLSLFPGYSTCMLKLPKKSWSPIAEIAQS